MAGSTPLRVVRIKRAEHAVVAEPYDLSGHSLIAAVRGVEPLDDPAVLDNTGPVTDARSERASPRTQVKQRNSTTIGSRWCRDFVDRHNQQELFALRPSNPHQRRYLDIVKKPCQSWPKIYSCSREDFVGISNEVGWNHPDEDREVNLDREKK